MENTETAYHKQQQKCVGGDYAKTVAFQSHLKVKGLLEPSGGVNMV